jgi:hypothetical protein
VLSTITPPEPFPITPVTLMPPAALEPSVNVLPPLLIAPATVKRLAELFAHACDAPSASPKLALPTLVACAPAFMVIPLPPMVSVLDAVLSSV